MAKGFSDPGTIHRKRKSSHPTFNIITAIEVPTASCKRKHNPEVTPTTPYKRKHSAEVKSTTPCKRGKKTMVTKNRVAFAFGTKKHDGLLPVSQLLDDLVWQCAMHRGSIRTPKDMLVFLGTRVSLLSALTAGLKDLFLRMSRTDGSKKIPVLAGGGGRAIVLPRSKRGYIMKLYELCCLTCRLLVRLYIAQKAQAESLKHVHQIPIFKPRPLFQANLNVPLVTPFSEVMVDCS